MSDSPATDSGGGMAQPDVTPMEDQPDVTPMEDQPDVTPMEDQPDVTPMEYKPEVTPMEDKPEVTPLEEDSSSVVDPPDPEVKKESSLLDPKKEELVGATTDSNEEKSSSPIPQPISSTPKPRIGPKSKMKNGEGTEALQSPVELQMDLKIDPSTTPIAASEPKKYRPGPRSSKLEVASGSDSPKLDDSTSVEEHSEPKKYRPGPKSKQQGGQSADEKIETQAPPTTGKPMPRCKRDELLSENLTTSLNIITYEESTPEQPRPRPGPKSKTRPVSTASSPPPIVLKKPGPKSKTQTISVETDSPKKKSGPKSKTAELTPKMHLESSSESLGTITSKNTSSKKNKWKASMKSFIDDSNSPVVNKKRRRSAKTSNLDLPVDTNFPILLEGSTDSSKIYALPNEWKKEYSRRCSGISEGKWDAYLHPPPLYKKRKIRSLPDLFSFIKEWPDCPIDPVFVNMDNTPSTLDGQIDSKLSAGACKVYDFVRCIQSGEDVDDFFPQTKKAKTSKGTVESSKSASGGTKSLAAKRITGMSPEAEIALLRHASSEMPSKKEMKKLAKASNLTFKLVKSWFTNYFQFKDRLPSSDFLFKEEDLPDFSDDSCDQLDGDTTNNSQADVEAIVTFTPV